GQGRMGLPISVVFLKAGYKVIGVDVNPELVEKAAKGYIQLIGEPGVDEGIKEGVTNGRYTCTLSHEEAIKQADIIIIIIPLILDENKNPNLSPLINLMQQIGTVLEEGQLVITETTLPIGTSEEIFKPILEEKSGLIAGNDFGLGFSPERTYSGRVIEDVTLRYPKIVGGINRKTTERMSMFYETFVEKGTIKMSSVTAAEAVKVFKGVFRDINIAIANEFAKLAESMKLNFYEIREAVNSEPFGNIMLPGAGVGGHCIPVYPHFLMENAKKVGLDLNLVKTGREINLSMAKHVIDKTQKALALFNKNLSDSKIVILGLAYRGNVKEHRYSPSLEIIKLLKEANANVILSDPFYEEQEIMEEIGISFQKDTRIALEKADCIIVLTDHDEYKNLPLTEIDQITNRPYVIVDTRNIWKKDKQESTESRLLLKIGI
ncbi:MAG: nucleotide sugar dehydrogenase, partial [Candidatus Thorarchaeota archaeon]